MLALRLLRLSYNVEVALPQVHLPPVCDGETNYNCQDS